MSIICFLFNLETQKLRFKKKKFFIEIIIILLKYQNCKSKFSLNLSKVVKKNIKLDNIPLPPPYFC